MKQFVVILFLLPGLVRAGELLRIEQNAVAMGTTFTLIAYGEGQENLEQAAEAAFNEAERLEGMLSNYRPQSEWSKINREAAKHPVRVTPELFHLLEACVAYSQASEGAFDITVGPLMRVWGFFRGTGSLPPPEQVASVMPSVGYRNLILDPKTQTVSFRKAGVEIDPGGIGKGYAVDRMIEKLKERNIRSALISAGGSSIYAMGNPPGDKGWDVKIRDPRQWSETIEDVYLKDQSMSTSGGYERFFEVDGKIYSHIMDPRTGYPASGVVSVSVIAPKTIDSEAWTKPFFILGRRWAAKHKPVGFRVYLCEDKPELSCEWLQ
jgi:thiamine biosynthesis lipoprotein